MTGTSRFFLPVMLFVLSGCSGVSVNPGSERLRVMETEPKGCLYVGEVSSLQKDRELGTLETEMSLDTRVDLRNKAHKLGANVLVFLKGKGSNILPGGLQPVTTAGSAAAKAPVPAAPAPVVGADGEEEAPEKPPLVFLATTFKCPSSIFNQ